VFAIECRVPPQHELRVYEAGFHASHRWSRSLPAGDLTMSGPGLRYTARRVWSYPAARLKGWKPYASSVQVPWSAKRSTSSASALHECQSCGQPHPDATRSGQGRPMRRARHPTRFSDFSPDLTEPSSDERKRSRRPANRTPSLGLSTQWAGSCPSVITFDPNGLIEKNRGLAGCQTGDPTCRLEVA
jgi:hypothetical protein